MFKKVFHLYEDMLPELRGVIVGEMEPEDRCRFTRCSKMSQKEAKSSKNYIYSLTFYASAEKYVRIALSHERGFERDHKGFSLIFEEDKGKKYKRCTSRRGNLLNAKIWKEDMDNSIDVIEYGTELFKNLLKKYQNTIKELTIFGDAFFERLKNYDFEIRSLNKLESLRIEDGMDVRYYLSKLKRPLKHLTMDGGRGASYLADVEELYRITDSVSMSSKLTYEQMCRLAAPIITIPFGDIIEMKICNFIRSWQNGTLGKKVARCYWNKRRDNTFDIPKLFRLLGLNGDFTPPPEFNANEMEIRPEPREIQFVIDHNHKAMLKGILKCNNYFRQLVFHVGYVRQ